MALLGFEGFDHLPVSGAGFNLGKTTGWSAELTITNGGSLVAGLYDGSGKALQQNNSGHWFQFAVGNKVTIFVYFRLKWPSFGSTSAFLHFMDGGTTHCGFAVNTSQKVIFWRGTLATVLATGTASLVAGSVYGFTCKVVFSNTVGTVDWKLDEVLDGTATGLDNCSSANEFTNAVRFAGTSGIGVNPTWDDVLIWDDTAGAPNAFIGQPVRVETLYTASDNAVTWTPLSSTNESNIDDISTDDDTTYNSSATPGQTDTFNIAPLTGAPVTIYGVNITASMRKDDATAQTVRTKLISGGTTQNGVSHSGGEVTTTYAYYRDQYTADPNTAAAWIAANVNACKIGYEHV